MAQVEGVRFGFFPGDDVRAISVASINHATVFNSLHIPNEGIDSRDGKQRGRRKRIRAHDVDALLVQIRKSSSSLKCPHCGAFNPVLRSLGFSKIFQFPLSARSLALNESRHVEIKAMLPSLDDMVQGDMEPFVPERSSGDEGLEEVHSKETEDVSTSASSSSSSSGRPHLLTPLECAEHLRLLWEKESTALEWIWGNFDYQDGGDAERLAPPILSVNESLMMELKLYSHLEGDRPMHIRSVSDYVTAMTIALDKNSGEKDDASVKVWFSKVVGLWVSLQEALNKLFDNSSETDPGIRQQLEKKEGLFRRNLMGKRVNFAARSVISPDPYIETDEIGLPVIFARTLTYREVVTPSNVHRLRPLIVNGPDVHPGANFVEVSPGHIISLKNRTRTQRIAMTRTLMMMSGQHAQVVHRHMQDGDFVLVNRQPTLHKPSIMSHRVRVLPREKTIRMHYANCNTYNADFDGDEINIHFPQDELGRAEAKLITLASRQYCVPSSGNPIRGLIQDHVIAGILLTKKDTFLRREEYWQLLYAGVHCLVEQGKVGLPIVPQPAAILKPAALWTGKQVVSTLLDHLRRVHVHDERVENAGDDAPVRPGVSLTSQTKVGASAWTYDGCEVHAEEGTVRIVDNVLVHGVLEKSQFGASAYGLIHALHQCYGPDQAGKFLTALSRLMTSYVQGHGFTCGIDDLLLRSESEKKRVRMLDDAEEKGVAVGVDFAFVKQGGKSVGDKSSGARGRVARRLAALLGAEQESSSTRERLDSVRERTKQQLDARMRESMASETSKMIETCLSGTTDGKSDGSLGPSKQFPSNNFSLMTRSGAKGSIVNFAQVAVLLGQQELEGRRVPLTPLNRSLPSFVPGDPAPRAGGYIGDRFVGGLRPPEFFFHCMAGREGLVDTAVKTARSGYLQRCLIKNLESLRVQYDGTVRDESNGSLVQFRYGDDGLDVLSTKWLEKFDFLKENGVVLAWKLRELRGSSESDALWSKSEGEQGSVLRLQCPDPFLVLERSASSDECFSGDSLSRKYAQAVLKWFSEKGGGKGGGVPVSVSGGVWQVDKSACSANDVDVARLLVQSYRSSTVHPGEAVGLLAAQSIGEPSTQMSIPGACKVLVKKDGVMHNVAIGELIDAYLPPITTIDQKDVLEVSNLQCTGVSPTESASWANVTHVSRHPANGDLITVKTERGREVKATASHSFLVRQKNRVVPIEGSNLVIGDCLPIVKDMPHGQTTIPDAPVALTRAVGRFIGAVVAEGAVNECCVNFCISGHDWVIGIVEDFAHSTGMNAIHKQYASKGGIGSLPVMQGGVHDPRFAGWMAEHFGCTSINKTLPAWILDAPNEFLTGLMQTFFDCSGDVETEESNDELCCHSESEELITMLCLCLARFGIATHVASEQYSTPDGEPGTIHRITIPMCFAAKFEEHIGFSLERKIEKLANVVRQREAGSMCDFQAYIPGMNDVLDALRSHVAETPIRGEFGRIQSQAGITPKMLVRCRELAAQFNAPEHLLSELDNAINADVWWDPIVSVEVKHDSKEMVYDFTVNEKLQSFMLSNGVFVHNTLNSVDWNTVMAIHWTGDVPPPKPANMEVGAFVDALMEGNRDRVQIQADGRTAYLPLPRGSALALSPDGNGMMMWTELEAVTRHPPVNADGSDTLVQVVTETGREVVVTKGKSLLVERCGKLVAIDGKDVRVGESVPIVRHLPAVEGYDHLELRTVFEDAEVTFTGSSVQRVVPTVSTQCHVHWPNDCSVLPDRLALDRDFGFFAGAYVAGGVLVDHDVYMTGVEDEVREACSVWASRHGIRQGKSTEDGEVHPPGRSAVRFRSAILVHLLKRTCGDVPCDMRVPGFAFAAPDTFVRGMLDGYFSRGGLVWTNRQCMTTKTKSKALRDGLSLLLSRFKISSKLSEESQMYVLRIGTSSALAFAREVGLTLRSKQELLENFPATSDVKEPELPNIMKNVYLDPIVGVKEVPSSHKFVYDLTVAETRNMTTICGFAERDTFHLAGHGAGNMTLGIPRLAELLIYATASPATPSMTLPFVKDVSEEKLQELMLRLRRVGLEDVTSSVDVTESWGAAAAERSEIAERGGQLKMLRLRLYDVCVRFDRASIEKLRVTVGEVRRVCQSQFLHHLAGFVNASLKAESEKGMSTIGSVSVDEAESQEKPIEGNEDEQHADESRSMVDVVAVAEDEADTTATDRDLEDRDGSTDHEADSGLSDVDDAEKSAIESAGSRLASKKVKPKIKKQSPVSLFMRDSTFVETELIFRVSWAVPCGVKLLMLSLSEKALAKSTVRSVKGVRDCTKVVKNDGSVTLRTDGTNLEHVLQFEDILDLVRIGSNDIHAVFNTFGIEAGRACLLQEVGAVFGAYGIGVNYRHLSVIADFMTWRGVFRPLNRAGMNSTPSPFLKMSFERTAQFLKQAALGGASDPLLTPSSQIVVGKPPSTGTGGGFDLLWPVDSQ